MLNTGFGTPNSSNMAPVPMFPMDLGWFVPAGDMYSTVADLTKLGYMFTQPGKQNIFKVLQIGVWKSELARVVGVYSILEYLISDIQYFYALTLGIKYLLMLNFGYEGYHDFLYTVMFYTSFSIFSGILDSLFQVVWYPPPPYS